MSTDQLKQLSHQLRLFGVHAHFERRAAEALEAQMHPLDFLRLILEDEALFRKERVGKTLATRARFRFSAEFEDWDHSYDRGIPKARLKELAELAFFHRQENLILLGKTGEGKTHLAVAIGRRLCSDGIQTRFLPVNLLFEEISAAKAAGKYLSFIRQLSKIKVLILDDFGLRSYSHDEATALVDILEDRYHSGILLITSQVEPRGWSKLFEDPVVAEAIIDRLIHPSQRLVLKGGSYRERSASSASRSTPSERQS